MPPSTSRRSEWGSGWLIKERPRQLGPKSNNFPVGGCSNADGGEGWERLSLHVSFIADREITSKMVLVYL